jgi:hypothetical protein
MKGRRIKSEQQANCLSGCRTDCGCFYGVVKGYLVRHELDLPFIMKEQK